MEKQGQKYSLSKSLIAKKVQFEGLCRKLLNYQLITKYLTNWYVGCFKQETKRRLTTGIRQGTYGSVRTYLFLIRQGSCAH